MVLFKPKFFLRLGSTGNASVYVRNTNGDWIEFTGYEYFKILKRQNQVSEFEVKFYDIQSGNKNYVKEFSEIMFFSDNALILKGRIQKVNYSTGFSAVVTGYGMEAKLMDKELVQNDNTSAAWQGEKRGQWSNISAQTIAKEILSSNTDGATPWIIQPATDGIFSSDYGNLSIRFEYANRLKSAAKLAESIDYEWWVDQDRSFADFFNIAQYQPTSTKATTSQDTFAISGANANASVTEKETDVSNMANKIDALGRGDGANQLSTSCFNASSVNTTLGSDITSTDTTITLTDASSFPASGTIRIMEEQITYTGKSGNDLTGATRGANSTTARTHKAGVYVEKHVTIANAESGSSIGDNGLLDFSIVNRDVIDLPTLELIASKALIARKDPIVRIRFTPNEPQETARDREIGELITINDSESNISDDYRIVSMKYTSDYGFLNMEIEASNKSLTFIEQMKKQQEEQENFEKYMQGATNIYAISSYENADSSNYLNLIFFIPNDAVAINKVLLNFKLRDFRAYTDSSQTASSGGGSTETTTAESSHGHVGAIVGDGSTDSAVYIPTGSGSGTLRWDTAATYGVGFTVEDSTDSHNHNVTIPNHTHNISMSFGIFQETLSSPSVDLYTGEDGGTMTQKDTYTTDQTEIDVTSEVAAVGAGKWVNLQFRPNKRMRIEANAYIKIFINSDT